MEQFTVEMQKDKTTKNTVRFEAKDMQQAGRITAVYIQKGAFKGVVPDMITVTVTERNA